MKYLIFSRKHSGNIAVWYLPNSCGYTQDINLAGRYEEEEALSIGTASHGNCEAIPEYQVERVAPKRTVVEVENIWKVNTPEADTHDIFLKAIDEHLIGRYLGTVDSCRTVKDVMDKINDIINWEVGVATDPSVNGGYKLVKVDD